jgi:hypothetical protein
MGENSELKQRRVVSFKKVHVSEVRTASNIRATNKVHELLKHRTNSTGLHGVISMKVVICIKAPKS